MPPILGDPEVDAYLERLLMRARAVLRDRLVGAWLVNSSAWHDYVPGRSDLDVAIGVDDRLGASMRHELADALSHGRLPCPARRLELVVYRRAALADPGPRPDWELNLNTGPAIDDHVGIDPTAEPAHWFVLDLSMAREAALPLAGPRLADLLGPLPDEAVIGALRASTAWHDRNDVDAPNRVLNACRAWRWLVERRWSSKTDAAAWAVASGGDGRLIDLALARRRGDSAEPLPVDRVSALATHVRALLDAAGEPNRHA